MKNVVPENISYMTLLEALAFKRFIGERIEDEEEFIDLVLELAGLYAQACAENRTNSGHLPLWIVASCVDS